MMGLNKELHERGELVSARGPIVSRIRRSWCAPVRMAGPITDGVFPESKEFLAGYWIIDVDNHGASL